jgi:hypothetical protein
VRVRTATLEQPSTADADVLDDTDVLTWWGHRATTRSTTRSSRGARAVLGGMGLLGAALGALLEDLTRCSGTPCACAGATTGERELVWTVDPSHPIAAGVPQPIVIDAQEMYGEPFDIPAPRRAVFISSFAGGEVFRGVLRSRGRGDLLLQPGRPGLPRLPPPRRAAGARQLPPSRASPTRTAAALLHVEAARQRRGGAGSRRSIPARTATTKERDQRPHGQREGHALARQRLPDERGQEHPDAHAGTEPMSATMMLSVAHHAPRLAPAHADRAQHAQLARALEDRQHERVDDPETGSR